MGSQSLLTPNVASLNIIVTRKFCFKGLHVDNVYVFDLDDVSSSGSKFIMVKNED